MYAAYIGFEGYNLHCDLLLLAARFLTMVYETERKNFEDIREGIRIYIVSNDRRINE